MQLEPLKSDEVFYFAFGSNMNPKVLISRRRVKPRQSLPCSVPGYMLSFGVQGFPYAEPGFATIVQQQHCQQLQSQPHRHQPQQTSEQLHQQLPVQGLAANSISAGSSSNSSQNTSQPPCVHGVLHRITRLQWDFIKATEGVGSSDVGYQVATVQCQLYDGITTTPALTLRSANASMHPEYRQALPSQRYLQLLQEGACHYRLDEQYQQWLFTLPAYSLDSIQQAIGKIASGALLLTAFAPALPVYITGRALGLLPSPKAVSVSAEGRPRVQPTAEPPAKQATAASTSSNNSAADSSSQEVKQYAMLPYLSWIINQAQDWTWWVHDNALEPILGSGCCNQQHQRPRWNKTTG
eukprot:GHRR01011466.1.p1 GENE.GHRR01011466.1~~GHRR01011466.1.p1  ORF type:complete len:352 (+),score=125.71 GHRR01011466.1:318-1373(+)